MRVPSILQGIVVVVLLTLPMATAPSARADNGNISLTIYKGGWFIGAAGAGLALGQGIRAIVPTNQHGAILELSGRQVGLMANADLSGLAITLK